MPRQIVVCVAEQVCMALLVLFVALPIRSRRKCQAKAARQDFVGDSACKECHGIIAETYLHTTHHLTSQLPTRSFHCRQFCAERQCAEDQQSRSAFPDGSSRRRFLPDGRVLAAAGSENALGTHRFRHRFRGKGTDLFVLARNQLFQLPVSYWTDLRAWVNSPGFTDGVADFNRPIVPRCLECHATYFASEPSERAGNFYRKSGFVLGISCERCHGPGGEHVRQKRLAAASGSAGESAIVNPASLTREGQMEICAQCHGGIGESLAPAFSYVAGHPLEKYIKLQRPDEDARVDVHGNQVALTQRSRCYQSSQMTCTTCHDVHAAERPAAAYSEKCLQCHKDKDCGEFAKLGPKIRENCIDCHMPVQDSNLIISNVAEKQVKAKMRNH